VGRVRCGGRGRSGQDLPRGTRGRRSASGPEVRLRWSRLRTSGRGVFLRLRWGRGSTNVLDRVGRRGMDRSSGWGRCSGRYRGVGNRRGLLGLGPAVGLVVLGLGPVGLVVLGLGPEGLVVLGLGPEGLVVLGLGPEGLVALGPVVACLGHAGPVALGLRRSGLGPAGLGPLKPCSPDLGADWAPVSSGCDQLGLDRGVPGLCRRPRRGHLPGPRGRRPAPAAAGLSRRGPGHHLRGRRTVVEHAIPRLPRGPGRLVRPLARRLRGARPAWSAQAPRGTGRIHAEQPGSRRSRPCRLPVSRDRRSPQRSTTDDHRWASVDGSRSGEPPFGTARRSPRRRGPQRPRLAGHSMTNRGNWMSCCPY
jgi:hypothetical protein